MSKSDQTDNTKNPAANVDQAGEDHAEQQDAADANSSKTGARKEGLFPDFEELIEQASGQSIFSDSGPVQKATQRIGAPIKAKDFGQAMADIARSSAAAHEIPAAMTEWYKIALGLSDVGAPKKDRRFKDSAWQDHPYFQRLGESYKVFEDLIDKLCDGIDTDNWEQRERARFFANIVTGAMSPTNTLLGNPEAIKTAVETGGASIARGFRNMVEDIANRKGMPRTVNADPFKVGKDVAVSPGAVVYRDEMFELLQYTPKTTKVNKRPILMVPPQLNRHYVLDLAPERSLVEYAVSHGIQTFIIVWRNPRKDHGHWGLDDYLSAMMRALDVVCEITSSKDANWLGLCAGGVTSSLLLGHLAAKGKAPINSATFFVTMLASRLPNMVGALASENSLETVKQAASENKVYDGSTVKSNFAWMRPNDMVYNYLVSGWLLGKEPPSFDILAWNDDATGITAAFERDTVAVLGGDAAARPNEVSVLGTPVDLSKVNVDTYQVAGETDHITTWRSCYLTSQILGGNNHMVVANTGHIQAFVNPPSETRYHYFSGLADVEDPEDWMSKSPKTDGSWWPEWIEWLKARSGSEKIAPKQLGNKNYPAAEAAPGTYVFEK